MKKLFNQKKFLPLNIQFFADDPAPTDLPTDPPTDLNSDTPTDPPKGGESELTADELDKLAESKFLKKLGVDDFSQLEKTLKSHKDWEESQKTEVQKQTDRLKDLETSLGTANDEKFTLQSKLAAYDAGVTGKNADAVIILAKTRVSDDVDINAAIKQVVDEYPHFAEAPPQEGKKPPQFVQDKHTKDNLTKEEAFMQAFN
ncbi:hypothetical protein [Paenisporosarcina sp. TG-14]|uniref:hypothetical protein n=1 Tax=Paenisporosarcina sp. TG-14 TaxID=1231057 RepID=UPI0002E1DA75|nr:hypothetical protein [Paenisporosarcina sp. TG-14]